MIELVERMHDSGMSYSQIAASLGISKGSIASAMRQHRPDRPVSDKRSDRWRVKQLLTAEWSCRDAAEIVGCNVRVAHEVFDEIWDIEK